MSDFDTIIINVFGISDEDIEANIDYYKHYAKGTHPVIWIVQDDEDQLNQWAESLNKNSHFIAVGDEVDVEVNEIRQALALGKPPVAAAETAPEATAEPVVLQAEVKVEVEIQAEAEIEVAAVVEEVKDEVKTEEKTEAEVKEEDKKVFVPRESILISAEFASAEGEDEEQNEVKVEAEVEIKVEVNEET